MQNSDMKEWGLMHPHAHTHMQRARDFWKIEKNIQHRNHKKENQRPHTTETCLDKNPIKPV